MTEVAEQSNQAVFRPGGDVLRRFMLDRSFVTIIQGPWGSGKSVGCMMKMYALSCQQAPSKRDGIRHTRWIVVRNTYGELKETTIKTWLDWFPEDMYGRFLWSKPMTHKIKIADMEMEVVFLALDDEEDRKKLLSLEMTGFFVNECREVAKGIIDDLTGRVGRYPSARDGGPSWKGGIMDTNAPDEEHWLPIMRGDVPAPEWMSEEDVEALKPPKNWEFYVQPGALLEDFDAEGNMVGYKPNPKAENIAYLPGGYDYYLDNVGGKARSWVNINYLNKLGSHRDGRPVWDNFREEVHVAREPLKPVEGLDVWVALDFGRQPAAICAQQIHGRWMIQHELIGQNMGATRFAPMLKRKLAEWYPPGTKFHFYGDPSGDFKGQADEHTPFSIFRQHGMIVRAAPGGNALSVRLQTVEKVLNEMVDGKPRFLVSPKCPQLRAAMNGGYRYRSIRGKREEYTEQPEKDKFSHIADALQYLMLGGGEGRELLHGSKRPEPVNAQRVYTRGDRGRSSFGGRLSVRR